MSPNGTAQAVKIPAATAQISYRDLYVRWEEGNWSATQLDFTEDKVDWNERMTPEQRRAAVWNFSLFYHGEHEVAEHLSAYAAASPLVEQQYFLLTQQVDEARHAIFFNRFLHEVAGLGDGTQGGGLGATEEQLTWGHRMVFKRLDTVDRDLRADPSPRRLAAALALYHIFVEATLAVGAQHMLEQGLERLDLLPGFREGLRKVSFDEQRHIAFGVKLISDLLQEDPGVQDAIVELFAEILPEGAAFARPPGWDPSYFEALDYSIEDLYTESMKSLEARLRAAGLPVDDISRFPVAFDIPPRQRATDLIALLRAGLIGPGDEPAQGDPEAMAILFDLMRRRADPTQVPAGTVIQWDFTDAEPWYIEMNGGKPRAVQGRAGKPDLKLRVGLQDWVDMAAGRASPQRLLVSRRLRPRGKLRVLGRLERVFA